MKHLVNFVRNFNEIEDELEISEVFKKIKDGEFELEIQMYRHALISNAPNASDLKKKLLAFTPSGVFDRARKNDCLFQYSGILHLDLDKLDASQMISLTSKLRQDDTVFAFFVSPSENGLKVFYRTNDTADNHTKNIMLLMQQFESKYSIKPDEQVKDISRLCFVSDDPQLYYNESSKPILFEKGKSAFRKLEILELHAQKVFKIQFELGQRNPYILKFASFCRNHKVPKELVEQYCIDKFEREDFKKQEILTTILSAYKKNYYEDTGNNIRNKGKREMLEQALTDLGFEFRFNVISNKTELSNNGGEWVEVDDRVENDILRLLESNGFSIRHSGLRTSTNSSFAHDYNPFIEYLSGLPPWDGEDHFKAIFDTLNVSEEYLNYLMKWYICMVASIVDENLQNQTVLLLIGPQGAGKSRWLQRLIPKGLKNYFVQGIFDPRDKDTKILMSENLIGNLDELDSMEKRDIPKYKEFITSPGAKVRASYGRNAKVFPRRISFCGSVNSLDFLQDLTGSRRFLCIEVSSINHTHNIDMDKVFSQAFALYKLGYVPYFTSDEIALIQERNKKFQAYSIEEELLLMYFEKDDNIPPDQRMAIVDIIDVLGDILGDKSKININPSKMGKILTSLGFPKVKTNGNFKYCIKRKLNK